jgi:hypothetical protein
MHNFTTSQRVIWVCIFSVLSGIFYTLELNFLGTSLGFCTAVALVCAMVGYMNSAG